MGAARGRANRELARLAARWVMSQAHATGANMVAVENLASMEPTFHKKLRTVLSQRLRGQLIDTFTLICKQENMRFEQVDPANTSKHCWACDGNVTHVKAPNNRQAGYHWASCDRCGQGRDRDWVGAVNVGARALRSPGTGERRAMLGHQPGSSTADLGNVTRLRTKQPQPAPKPRRRKPAVPTTTIRVRGSAVTAPKGAPTNPQRTSRSRRQRLSAGRAVTPPQPGYRSPVVRVVHRCVGTGLKPDSTTVRYSGGTSSTVAPLTVSVRVLDGARYAHRHRIKSSPVRLPVPLPT